MINAILIVQGEGRGHLSQSIALSEYLEEAGHRIQKVFVGSRPGGVVPEYFSEFFKGRLELFQSPYFLRTPNQKGIDVGRSLIMNLFRSSIYLHEMKRIRKSILEQAPDAVFNFYDLVGAFALRKTGPGIRRIGIGHHFLLHLEAYRSCRKGMLDRWLLQAHTRLVLRSCDRIMALSFRAIQSKSGIEVIPPLIREPFRRMVHRPGNRYLAYLMTGGYLYDLIRMCREDPDFKVDVFTELKPGMDLPAGMRIHPFSENRFRELMSQCKGVISTAGFDTAAEAAYHGIPLLVIPARSHYEQYCNSRDVEQSGIGKAVYQLVPGIQAMAESSGNNQFREWADRAGSLILQSMMK